VKRVCREAGIADRILNHVEADYRAASRRKRMEMRNNIRVACRGELYRHWEKFFAEIEKEEAECDSSSL